MVRNTLILRDIASNVPVEEVKAIFDHKVSTYTPSSDPNYSCKYEPNQFKQYHASQNTGNRTVLK